MGTHWSLEKHCQKYYRFANLHIRHLEFAIAYGVTKDYIREN